MEQRNEKRYYISLRGEQVGPFTLEELAHQPVRKKTLVWNEDEWMWRPAAQVAAVADLFRRSTLLTRLRRSAPWQWLSALWSSAHEQQPTQLAR